MQHLRPLLERLGLNHHESAVYLHLLASREQPASLVARSTKIPRSTVRGILSKLCERGIVTKLYRRNTQYYSCLPPASLVQHLQRSIDAATRGIADVQEALPQLESLHAQRGIVPRVQVFEGPELLIEAFNRSLYEDIDELLIFTSYEFLKHPLIRRNDAAFFVPKRIERGIRARVLVGRTEGVDARAEDDRYELRERRSIPEQYRLPGNIHVYGDSVMYFSASEDEYLAILIESAMMAETMRALFECLWGMLGSTGTRHSRT